MHKSLYSTLYIYKNRAPNNDRFKKGDLQLIFTDDPACLGRAAYSVPSINKAFEQNINKTSLLKRMVWMMSYLQKGYHTRNYDGPAGKYIHANEEYPEKYKALVRDLSDEALEIIKNGDFSHYMNEVPPNIGHIFHQTLIQDRKDLQVQGEKHEYNYTSLET